LAVESSKAGRKRTDRTVVAVGGAMVLSIAAIFELSRAFDWVVFPQLTSFACLTVSQTLINYGPNLVIALVVLLVWLLAASLFVDANKFSLHAYYRNRLVRAYLGASNKNRRPNAFTRF